MPTFSFTKDVECPAGCNPPTPEECKFEITISYNEVEDSSRIYASNLVFEMKPEQATPTCELADFGWGDGPFELTPKGGTQFSVDGTNVWQQQRAVQAGGPAGAGPGGTDVDYRDLANQEVTDKSSGEPFRIKYSGLLQRIKIDVRHPVTCGCPGETNSDTLRANHEFNSRPAPTPSPSPGGGNGGGWW